MKLKGTAPAAAPAPAEPISEPADDAGFGDFGGDEGGSPAPAPSDDKPFKDEPFDAGVEADEETDPKKFIEQLTGKLGQSLRKYTEEQGQPDFDLEKFAINSLISATHTAEMDEEDRKDIIKKINTSGDDGDDNEKDSNDSSDDMEGDMGDNNTDNDSSGDEFGDDMGSNEFGDEELQEGVFILDKDQIKRSSLFAPEGSKEAKFKHEEEMVAEDLNINEKSSIFDKNYLKSKLQESFNQEETMSEPMIEPQVPAPKVVPNPNEVQPNIAPSRKNRPFLPMPGIKTDPKAIKR